MLSSANSWVPITSLLAGASAPYGLGYELSAGESVLTGFAALLAMLLVGGWVVSRLHRG